MGPKKAKECTDDENYWRLCIEETPLNDETWTVKVILMEAAGSEHDRIYLNKFENYAAQERRFVIKNICKTETTFMINQLGGEKKVKDDNLRVFEEGQSYLKEKRDVPPEIMALIIKHLILKMKEEYLFIKRQRLEVREGIKRESATMINRAEVKGTVNVKLPEQQDTAPSSNIKKTETDVYSIEIDENKKYSTLLRVRGEEWRDKIYIDDYPTDGPNLYIAVTGFLEPNLAGCLIKVGIPLTAVVQIRIDSTHSPMPSSLLRATKRGQSQTEMQTEKSLKFWEDLQRLRINMASANDFKNTAFVVFTPPYWNTENLSGCTEKIYDEICYLLYDIQDLTRQHMHYLDNMDIITIPDDNKVDFYKSFYQKHLDGIPFESVSAYLVLDAILQAVCKNNTSDKNSRSTISSLDDTFNIVPVDQSNIEEIRLHQSEKLVKDLINDFCKVDSQKKKYRLTNGDEYIDHKNPIVLQYGDFCKNNTFHLGNINLDNIVYSMLYGIPLHKLWLNRNKPTEEMSARNNFHVNLLLSCFDRDDVETAELCRLIHILTCRKLYNNRSSLKKSHILPSTIAEFKKIYLKRSILAEPLNKYSSYRCQTSISSSVRSSETESEESHEIISDVDVASRGFKLLFDCPDISELVSAVEIANQKPCDHMIDEYKYFEDFTGTSAFQIILDAFNTYNCIDYKYCEVTDCFVTMFYNSYDKDSITREEWRCHLPTPVCLQDFFDFVLEEHYDWIQNEEKNYDEHNLLRSQSEFKNTQQFLIEKSCVENSEVEMDLLMEGSLKYEEIKNDEIIDVDTSDSKVFITKKTPVSTTDMDSTKSSRKTKSPAISTPKVIRNDSDSEANVESLKKPFFGYDLGDRRVEVFGKDSSYFAKDGTRISSSYFLIIPMNLEYVNLNIITGNSNNEFWVHNKLGELKLGTVDIRESFRVHTKDQLIMYVKKQLYKVVRTLQIQSGETIYKANPLKSPSSDLSDVIPEIYETKSFHSLFVTWPNGLVTESVHENNSAKISHIKQHYLIPLQHLDEDMRCISLEGEVVIFKSNNEIEILKPDSTYIRITKCEKKMINDENPENMITDTNSDKSKKGKDKQAKASSKPSKKMLIENDKNTHTRSIEHELIIEEFETIGSNGLRQKWVQNNKFDIEKLLIKTATDFCLGEIFSKRMDGTNVLLNKDGVQVVTFPNNTRIITSIIIEDEEIFPEWTKEEMEYFSINNFNPDVDVFKSESSINQNNMVHTNSISSDYFASTKLQEADNNIAREDGYISINIAYTIEHSYFTTVTINKYTEKISIESPNNTCVTVDTENIYEFTLDKQTSAYFDGNALTINYDICPESNIHTNCEVKMKSGEVKSVSQLQKNWLNMTDSSNASCKKISVDEEGNINVIEKVINDENLQRRNSKCSDEINSEGLDNIGKIIEKNKEYHNRCEEMWKSKQLKFFILRRDLTCSELIHRAIVERYKEICRSHRWCSVNQFDTFGDHRSIWSILTPVHINESEKWLMDSKLSPKPKKLTYKDLVDDTGKGFYHWMRPYKRFQPEPIKPKPVLPERLPRAFVLRTLEQQWNDSQSEKLRGAKELSKAILCYRNRLEANRDTILKVPVEDRRPENERKTDDLVQAIANRVYKDLKERLAEDMQLRAQPTITTKPCSLLDEISEEESEEESQELKFIKERRENLKETESAEATTINLKRYWNRRAEEFKEEQFYKYLLQEGSVPPYFRNVLGGAIWWQMSKAADDAVTKAERRHMQCVCDED
ncbi:uncharacterized protein LOC126780641 [Nymphalis io]|uniref:uncharacterized protein LOC126780641 n=1 Tax=Inachis io TaxID=171585 RepID=UPI002169EC24|nr:uncharacterized protein LOC126780641 [Nymphalis io]